MATSKKKPQAQAAVREEGITEPIVIASTNAQVTSRPFFSLEITLNSLPAQQILTRTFMPAADGIFSLSVILPAITERQTAEQAQQAIFKGLDNLHEDIKSEQVRLQTLAESNGIPLNGVKYTDARKYSVQVSSPRASGLIRTISEMDKLIEMLDALWLMGVIPQHVYNDEIYKWKRKVVQATTGIRRAATRALIAANMARNKANAEAEQKSQEPAQPPTTTDEPPSKLEEAA